MWGVGKDFGREKGWGSKCRCLTEHDASGTWGSLERLEEERHLDYSAEGVHLSVG